MRMSDNSISQRDPITPAPRPRRVVQSDQRRVLNGPDGFPHERGIGDQAPGI